MKISAHNNTDTVILESENESDVMILGRISSRIPHQPRPTHYNSGDPWKLELSIQKMIELLAS